MALIFADGGDHYGTTADMLTVYTAQGAGVFLNTDLAFVRTGTGSFGFTNINNQNLWRANGSTENTMIASIAFLFNSGLPTNSTSVGMYFSTISDTTTMQVKITIGPDGAIYAYRGATLLGKSDPNLITAGSYSSIQARVFCANAGGSVEVRLNGKEAPVLLLEGVDTQNQATDVLGSFGFGILDANHGSPGSFYCDDHSLLDTTGATDNDFLGDMRCRTRLMNANGPTQDWISFSGGPAFDEINKVPADPATNNIYSTAADQVSNFAMDAVPDNTSFSGGMFVFALVSKTDAGAAGMNMSFQSGASETAPVAVNPGTTPGYYYGAFPVDPATGTYWTKDALQAALFKAERTL